MLFFFTVAYFPDHNILKNAANAVLAGFKVYIYNNGLSHNIHRELSSMPLTLLGTGSNDGLGVAFAEFEVNYLTEDDFYFYLDQDSSLGLNDWFLLASRCKASFYQKNVGMLHISKCIPRSSILTSSGSVYSGFIIRYYVRHDPTFFVEGVDYDYCYRLFRHKLSVLSIPLESFDHTTLQDGIKICFLGLSFWARNYSLRRVVDFNYSHARLIIRCLLSRNLVYSFYFMRSLLFWNIRNILSGICLFTGPA